MTGVDIAHDLEGHVQIKTTVCPYCNSQFGTFTEAAAHDATCEKHPAVIRLAARERDIKRAVEAIGRAAACWSDANAVAFLRAAREALQPLPEAPDAGN
jgi:hypothetical protein